jgi:hypothetical protein
MEDVDQLLERLDQWAGFSLASRSVIRRRMAYGACFLFLLSLLLPVIGGGPVLTAKAVTYPGLFAWAFSFVGFLTAPAKIFQIGSAWFSEAGQKPGILLDLFFYMQLAVHAGGNFLLLAGGWIRFEDKLSRAILYTCTLLALSIVINPAYEIGRDLLIGYYLWVAAHITLSGSTWMK